MPAHANHIVHGSARRAGFTLIELVVVIGVIAVLLGLTVTAGTSAILSAERQRTQTSLTLLDMAVTEWETLTGSRMTHGKDDVPAGAVYQAQIDTPWNLVLTEVLDVVSRPDSVKTILAGIESQNWYQFQPGVYPPWVDSPFGQYLVDEHYVQPRSVMDAWDWPIYATMPGRLAEPGDTVDTDGTRRTPNENVFGIARSRRICFVSAGPDRAFGSMSQAPGSVPHDLTRDNLYSYEPDQPPSINPGG